MAGTGVFTQPIVGLTDIIGIINRLPHFTGKTVLTGSSNLFISNLHRFSAGGTVNDTVEQVVERAGIAIHNGWPAVDQVLNFIPFFWRNGCFMTVLNDFPFLTRNDTLGVGTKSFLVCPKNLMGAFIKGIPQNMTDSGTAQ